MAADRRVDLRLTSPSLDHLLRRVPRHPLRREHLGLADRRAAPAPGPLARPPARRHRSIPPPCSEWACRAALLRAPLRGTRIPMRAYAGTVDHRGLRWFVPEDVIPRDLLRHSLREGST